MANSLLDFVMSVVKDPDVAARYAADPAQAIADAHLTDVTSADVNNLIPVVSESLSMSAPTGGSDGFGAADNVWASGAATAAFDAFDAFDDHGPVEVGQSVIDHPGQLVSTAAGIDPGPADTPFDDGSLQVPASVIDDAPAVVDHVVDADWAQPVIDGLEDLHHPDSGPSFDIFG